MSTASANITARPDDMQHRWWCWLLGRDGQEGEPYEYIAWVQTKWHEWSRATNRWPPHGQSDHDDFDAWLAYQACPECRSTGYVHDSATGELMCCGYCTAHGFREPPAKEQSP